MFKWCMYVNGINTRFLAIVYNYVIMIYTNCLITDDICRLTLVHLVLRLWTRLIHKLQVMCRKERCVDVIDHPQINIRSSFVMSGLVAKCVSYYTE